MSVLKSLLNPQNIIVIIFWIAFSTVYLTAWLYEKTHEQKVGDGNLIARNYPLTLWVWGAATFASFFAHKYVTFGTIKSLENPYFASNWITFIPLGYREQLLIILGFCFLSGGLALVALGRVQINGLWRTHICKFENHILQTEGVYSQVRHPIYNGQNYMAIGTFFVLDTFSALIFPIAVWGFNYLRAHREEQELEKFQDLAYLDYKRNVHRSMCWPIA